ncbi:CesT family type III secretion system chaperone [Hahella aquimaris]|uniref:CesT family type III secretion system chaperone n=1 Tax=Hahella sp. HNIBRBA332 TaxID=3015983 RepID=UPI00273C0CD5|nr:CesT family type III secretion system chaperone [Hahella sp. HNIBRBA332]WLQ16518.1 CesT family type III secretion system chaperone [Hahella sp. HNIBRBA332]
MSAQKDTFSQWLMELNNQWGQDCLALDASNQCHLLLDNHELSFALSNDEQELSLWSPVASAEPFLGNAERLTELLVMNFSDHTLAGSTFAMDSRHSRVLLCFRVPIKGLDAHSLGNVLRNFGETISHVEGELLALANRGEESREPAGSFPYLRA